MIGVALLLAGSVHADQNSAPEAPASETQTVTQTAKGLMVSWDAERGAMVAPDDNGTRWIAEEMQRLFAAEAELLEKAGLLEPRTLDNGMIGMRVSPLYFNTSIIGPIASEAISCSQSDVAHSHEQPAVKTQDRPHSTPATEGWVTQ